ncbi:hypothetical protein [Oryza sativa Japonica Group]|uniref:Uncharacterized protein n=1 Tax=Oryza sativa subsp. japonica TaxID=39947 RepID=Q5ZAT7_ORYSJ|nr:hypothetical protein [Oryza sativa Japonica Group]BAD53296.1 hypothetical protein [Oryza sativa Japonica Group]
MATLVAPTPDPRGSSLGAIGLNHTMGAAWFGRTGQSTATCHFWQVALVKLTGG